MIRMRSISLAGIAILIGAPAFVVAVAYALPTCDKSYLGKCHTWGPNDPIYSGYCCTWSQNHPRSLQPEETPNAVELSEHCGDLKYVEAGVCGSLVANGHDCGGGASSPSCL
jgi:hypothetical protein